MSAMPNLRLVGDASAQSAPGYLTPKAKLDDLRRQRRIRGIFRDLDSGRWAKVLLDLKLTQHRYRDLARHGGEIGPLLEKVNFFRMANSMHATIAAGEPVSVSVPEGFDEQAAAIDDIRTRVLFDGKMLEAAHTVNVEMDAVLRVSVDATGTVITLDDSDCTLPVGPNGPDGQPTVWERRWRCERNDASGRAKTYLRVERHRTESGRGIIEQEAYTARTNGGQVSDSICDLAELRRVPWADAQRVLGLEALTERVETGSRFAAIVRLFAARSRGEPTGKITEHDLDLIDAGAAAFSRMSRSHDLHAQPLLRISEDMIDKATGNVTLGQDAILDPEKLVEYINQGFDLGALLDALDRTLSFQLVMLRMSQSLIGFKMGGGAAPDSFDKVKLESTNALSWGQQTATYFEPQLGRLFTIASEIDAHLPMRGYAVAPARVEMSPELPKDWVQKVRDTDEAVSRKLMSRRTALVKLYGLQNGEKEFELIREEEADAARNAAASIFMGEPAGGVA